MLDGVHDLRLRIAERSAPLMFAISLAFLVCMAVLVVVLVDVPNFSENVKAALDANSPEGLELRDAVARELVDHRIQIVAIVLMAIIWPIVILESVFHWLSRPWHAGMRRFHFFGLLFCICPALRMCARSPEMGQRLWLPGLGWRQANKRLRRRLEHNFSVPMIGIALLILPVLVVEFFMKAQVAQYAWLRMVLHISTGVIWFAFAAEFILMVSVAEKKIAYCKSHWIDLAIILLPIVSFLRSLRVLRAANALRVPQLTKMARIYRLRGTAVKGLRALILLEVIQRVAGRNVDRSIEKLQLQLADVEAEAKEIRRKIAKLERDRRQQEGETRLEPCVEADTDARRDAISSRTSV